MASARVFPLPGYSANAYVATIADLLLMLGRDLSHPSPWSWYWGSAWSGRNTATVAL